MPSKIYTSTNSNGLRGRNLPKDPENYVKIITVGGSTTICTLNPDTGTWSYFTEQNLLKQNPNVWLNNAGLNGHSTFGHKILLEDYLIKLKPQCIIFLIGLNDMEREKKDVFLLYDQTTLETFRGKLKNALLNSEIVGVLANVYRKWNTNVDVMDNILDWKFENSKHLSVSEDVMQKNEQDIKEKFIPDFKDRISELGVICKENNIVPVFMTQTLPYGNLMDPTTKINMATAQFSDGVNGEFINRKLNLYNKALIETCIEDGYSYIDLASSFPKDTKYYYDPMHYTIEGNKHVANFISEELISQGIILKN